MMRFRNDGFKTKDYVYQANGATLGTEKPSSALTANPTSYLKLLTLHSHYQNDQETADKPSITANVNSGGAGTSSFRSPVPLCWFSLDGQFLLNLDYAELRSHEQKAAHDQPMLAMGGVLWRKARNTFSLPTS